MNSVVEKKIATPSATSVHQRLFKQLKHHLNQRILGQTQLIERLLIALLANGHLLVEGAPGLAKTKAIKELAACLEGQFHRIQFTPDLLPADITGTEIYRPQDGSFKFQPGPLFNNLVLADEINRAPAKVQSALLEAMAEHQITIGRTTYELPELFLVMATQNPIEQEGTHTLPEAQLDRFMMYVKIDYPEATTEKQILDLALLEARHPRTSQQNNIHIPQASVFAVRQEILDLHCSQPLHDYMVQLVVATRQAKPYSPKVASWIRFGASPRGTISLARAAKAHAWLDDRDYVSPEDVHAVAYDVLRHRIVLNFEAEAEGITTEHVIGELLKRIAIP